MLTRRQFLLGSGVLGLAGVMSFAYQATQAQVLDHKQWLISACTIGNHEHYVAAFDHHGQLISRTALPARGHGVIAHPNKPGHGLIIARRPGYYIIEVNFANGQITRQISPENGQHFFGHGLFSADGQVLVTTENHIDSGQGRVVLRDANSYQLLSKFDSGGIGPHEALAMPDGKTLVVANGGILTHPNQPRKKINLATMKPNLAYIDLNSGKIINRFTPDNHQLSIRHLAVSRQGKVIGGLQYQGTKTDLVPLAFSHQFDQGQSQLKYLKADDEIWRSMKQYTASVCIDDHHQIVAISCPRGNMLTYWHLDNGQFMAKQPLKDGAGLALYSNTKQNNAAQQIVATSGKGKALFGQQHEVNFKQVCWDNHLTAIDVG